MAQSIARRCVWCALLLLLSTPLHAQTIYDLSAKYVEGQSWVFDFVTVYEVKSDMIEGGAQSFQLRQQLKEEVEEIHEDGSLDILLTILSNKVEGPNILPDNLTFEPLVGAPLRKTVDKNGVVRRVEAVEPLPKSARIVYLQFKQALLSFGRDLYLPGETVAMGESWTKETPISIDTPMGVIDQLYSIEAKLNNIVNYKGSRCYEVLFEGEFTGTLDQGAGGEIDGALSGRILLDTVACQFVRFEYNHSQSMRIRESQGDYSIEITLKQTYETMDETESIR